MTDDMRRYRPNVAKILRESTPEKLEERRRKALQGLVDEGLIDRLTPTPVPSAADPAEETPVTKPARPAARRRWPATWIVVLGCVGVMLTAMLAAVLVVTARAKEAADKAAAMMSAAATATAVTTAPIATAAPVATAEPSAPEPSAAVQPAPPAPLVAPRKPKLREASDDPYDGAAAPSPPTTAKPVATDILP